MTLMTRIWPYVGELASESTETYAARLARLVGTNVDVSDQTGPAGSGLVGFVGVSAPLSSSTWRSGGMVTNMRYGGCRVLPPFAFGSSGTLHRWSFWNQVFGLVTW